MGRLADGICGGCHLRLSAAEQVAGPARLPAALHALPPHPGAAVSAPHVLHCDGAARGNPGPAAIGAVLFAPGKLEPVAVVSEAIGRATNNEAEYRALLAGLEAALAAGVTAPGGAPRQRVAGAAGHRAPTG